MILTRDDASYLQKLMCKSSTVVTLPPGHYNPSHPIILSGLSDLTIFAYGVSLMASPTQPTDTAANGDTLQIKNCNRVKIFGMRIDGNRVARGGFANNPQAIDIYCSNDILIEDCWFTGAVCDDIFAWGGFNPLSVSMACQRVTLHKNNHRDPGRNCVSLVGAAWSSVCSCDFEGPGGDPGVAVDIEANGGDPIGINHHISIQDNRVRNFKGAFWAIKTANPYSVSVSNNVIDGTSSDAIFCEGTQAVICGNAVTNCARSGVSVCNGGNAIITGNQATVYAESGSVVDGVLK